MFSEKDVASQGRDWRGPALLVAIVSLVLFLLSLAWSDLDAVTDRTGRSEIKQAITTAEQKPLVTYIPASGVLKSKSGRRIVNQVPGRLILLPQATGQQVRKGDLLFRLENSEIQKQYSLAQQEKLLAEAQMRSLQSELKQQKNQLTYDLELSKGELKIAMTELHAKQQLQQRNIISVIELERQQVLTDSYRLKVALLQQQLNDFDASASTKLEAAKLTVSQSYTNEIKVKEELELLNVRAEIDGILQDLDTSLYQGDWMDIGRNLALVADTSKLFAEVRVNASDIQKLQLHQQAEINIKGFRVSGQISRIAPRVEHNQVQVDLELSGELPATALPFVEVSAAITVLHKEMALVIDKPAYFTLEANQAKLWARNQGEEQFGWHSVEVGMVTEQSIEILSGLSKGAEVSLDLIPEDV